MNPHPNLPPQTGEGTGFVGAAREPPVGSLCGRFANRPYENGAKPLGAHVGATLVVARTDGRGSRTGTRPAPTTVDSLVYRLVWHQTQKLLHHFPARLAM